MWKQKKIEFLCKILVFLTILQKNSIFFCFHIWFKLKYDVAKGVGYRHAFF